jgi:hypothetical protein
MLARINADFVPPVKTSVEIINVVIHPVRVELMVSRVTVLIPHLAPDITVISVLKATFVPMLRVNVPQLHLLETKPLLANVERQPVMQNRVAKIVLVPITQPLTVA